MKLPKPRKLKSGNYFVQIMIDGQRISHTGPTAKDCNEWVLKLKAGQADGATGIPDKANATVGFAVDSYINSRTNVLSPSTIGKYRQIRKDHFKGVMDKKIAAIRNWQVVVNAEADKGYSPKTVINAWSLVHSSLKKMGVVVNDIQLPQLVQEEIEFLDYEQIEVFVKAIYGKPVEMAALLALHSLRRSEILAMTKDKVSNGILHVRGAVVSGKDSKLTYKETNKTRASRRDIPIMIPRLQELIDSFDGSGKLCIWGGTKILKDIKKVCEENDLPIVGIHGLRHSFASLCYHLELPERETMRLGGWDDPTVLRKIYTHLANADSRKAEEKIRSYFTSFS